MLSEIRGGEKKQNSEAASSCDWLKHLLTECVEEARAPSTNNSKHTLYPYVMSINLNIYYNH